ncbi:uncharacterized protein [Diadema antillarum]|uniref:uncharacterized protein n=1 Tax=Diadema antillarum TaxID=105358 RepID=UPI003A8AD77A
MTGGSYRIDLKRDDPRTLMIKMDARLTFAGRERNHAFRMDAERELRHLDYARHLTRATLERQQKEMHKRMNFLKNLVEENRARRKKMEEGGGDKLVSDTNTDAPADRRSRKEEGLRHTLPILPMRRNLEDFVSSLNPKQGGASAMSRSLGYLSDSFQRSRTQESLSEKRLRQLRQDLRNAKKKEIPPVQLKTDDRPTETPKVVWSGADGEARLTENEESKGNNCATHNISLPEIAPGPPKSREASMGRRVSLSQMIATGEITKLPVINPGDNAMLNRTPQSLNLARTFYMNTSQTSGRGPILQPIQQNQRSQQQQSSQANINKRGGVKLPPAMVPLKFLQEDIEKNPFMSSDFNPKTYRPRELLNANKPEEMYVWLGFDSEDEFREMVAQAKQDLDDGSDDNSSNGGDVVELDVIDEVPEEEVAEGDDIEKEGAEYLSKRKMSRRVSRLSAPVAMIASSLNRELSAGGKKPSSALKKFIRAAKTICVVRQFQLNGDDTEET